MHVTCGWHGAGVAPSICCASWLKLDDCCTNIGTWDNLDMAACGWIIDEYCGYVWKVWGIQVPVPETYEKDCCCDAGIYVCCVVMICRVIVTIAICWVVLLLGTIDWRCKFPHFRLQNWTVFVRTVYGLRRLPPKQKFSCHQVTALGAAGFSPLLLMLLGYHLPLLLYGFVSWMYRSKDMHGWGQMLYVGEDGVGTARGIHVRIFSCYHIAKERNDC